ncbi:DUF6588 family protein [Mucilaginibacter calamicampi]|uniref:DUF6588 family protein n=1 Tax=Mucilaginibacter calamicampi TaxID=1302352 RepID=A0ABW2YRD8_9SPHI
MRKLYSFITALLLTAVSLTASAQDGFDELIRSNAADATILFTNYANPLFRGFGTGLNSGWNNTAATKKLLHFDLRITANGAFVPTSDKSFDVTKVGLTRITPANPSDVIAPTFGGKDAEGPLMNVKDGSGQTLSSFRMPKGIFHIIPAPTVQLTVGLVQNTDVTFRITPDIKLGDDAGKVGMFGIGVKHNIIKDFVKTSSFDLALAVNYSRINYSKTLNVANEDGTSNASNNQRVDAKFSGVNVQAILSKKLLFFTPFVAVAYQSANTEFGVLGKYVVKSGGVAGPTGPVYTYNTLTDPVNINQNSIAGLRTDVGFQLNLAVFRIYASGSLGQYKSVNGGIGLGF